MLSNKIDILWLESIMDFLHLEFSIFKKKLILLNNIFNVRLYKQNVKILNF